MSHVNSYDYAIGRATVDIGVNPLAITRATLACERTTTRTSICEQMRLTRATVFSNRVCCTTTVAFVKAFLRPDEIDGD